MKFIERANKFIKEEEVKEASKDLLGDTIDAAMGNPASAGKVLIALAKAPFFIRERMFWDKMSVFLDGVYLDEKDCAKLRAKLTEKGKSRDNALRLIAYIDRSETEKKIKYLINATRCLLVDFIDRPMYFRICHAITHTLDEDLIFLGEHIGEEDIAYNAYVQGLVTTGLMTQTVFDGNGEQEYSFTTLAELVDRYAINYDNTEKYPNPLGNSDDFVSPKIKMPDIPEAATVEEIEEMFKD